MTLSKIFFVLHYDAGSLDSTQVSVRERLAAATLRFISLGPFIKYTTPSLYANATKH